MTTFLFYVAKTCYKCLTQLALEEGSAALTCTEHALTVSPIFRSAHFLKPGSGIPSWQVAVKDRLMSSGWSQTESSTLDLMFCGKNKPILLPAVLPQSFLDKFEVIIKKKPRSNTCDMSQKVINWFIRKNCRVWNVKSFVLCCYLAAIAEFIWILFKKQTENNCQKNLHPTAAEFIWSIFPFHIVQIIAAFSSGTEHVAERLCSTHQNQQSACFHALVTDAGSLSASQRGKDVKMSLLSVCSSPPASLTAAAFPAWTGSTHVVSCDDQLNHILGVLVQDFHCGSRYERSEILQGRKRKWNQLLESEGLSNETLHI